MQSSERHTRSFNLISLMRKHKVTIRDLSKRMNVTQKAIRRIRSMERVSYLTYCDYHQGVTGENVFNYKFYLMITGQEPVQPVGRF